MSRIACHCLERGVLKELKYLYVRDGVIVKSRIKELHTFEGLVVKVEVIAGDICAIVEPGFEIEIQSLILKILTLNNYY
jgi:GTP-binding protein